MDSRFTRSMALAQEVLDFELSPSRSAKDAIGVLGWMVSKTLSARADPELSAKVDVVYGPAPRQRLDVFCPRHRSGEGLPCLVFIHGGFWQEGDKSVAGFAAQTFGALGWAYVSVGYTLTPEASLTQITQQISDAVSYIHEHANALGIDPQRIVVAGHSAGAHLAASLVANVSEDGVRAKIAGVVLVSGVFELAPVARSYVNDRAKITEAEIGSLSPLRSAPCADKPVHILVGGDEPAAFQEQSEVLRDVWGAEMTALTCQIVPGRDHFDILQELTHPESVTMEQIFDMVRR